MAFTETFLCDVCGQVKKQESEDWWLAWTESAASPVPGEAEQPSIRLTPWNSFLAHSSDARHLCSVSCAHTLIDRWMLAEL